MATYQYEKVNCGNPRCKRCSRGGVHHGPYWYAYWKEGGKTRSRYVGKKLHNDAKAEEDYEPPPAHKPPPPPRDTDYNLLGLDDRRRHTFDEVRSAYRRAAYANHPDRGGEHKVMVAINRAWERLRARHSAS